MSYTEIYIIKRENKHVEYYDRVKNAWGGAMHIWEYLEQKYLPSLKSFPWETNIDRSNKYKSRIIVSMVNFQEGINNPISEIWNLSFEDNIQWKDRIIMASTMDNMYIGYKYLPELADAYRTVEYATDNMKTQADIMDKIHAEYSEGEIIGIFILGTSVSSISDQVSYDKDDVNFEIPLFNESWYDGMYEMEKFKEFGFDVKKLINWEKDNKITDYE